jgi:hypothetical protein
MTDILIHDTPVRLGEKRPPPQETHIPVHLPQLFVLFLSENPIVNPYYSEVRKESEEWLAKSVTQPRPRRTNRPSLPY